jgi:hypothetical protein
MITSLLRVCALVLGVFLGGPYPAIAGAQLDAIRARGSLRCGVSEEPQA